jgi:hypothetical protein
MLRYAGTGWTWGAASGTLRFRVPAARYPFICPSRSYGTVTTDRVFECLLGPAVRRFFRVCWHISIKQLAVGRVAVYVVSGAPSLIVNRTPALATNRAGSFNRRQYPRPVRSLEKRLYCPETVARWVLIHRQEAPEIAPFVCNPSFIAT